jgi:hypothetical protein
LRTAEYWVQANDLGSSFDKTVDCELSYLPLAFLPLAALARKEANTMKRKMFTRRRFMATSAVASTTMIAAPFVKTAHAAASFRSAFGTILYRTPTRLATR